MLSMHEIMQRVANGMTKEEADTLLADRVKEIVALGESEEEATRRTLVNIGYFAGYYSREMADKTYDLFNTEHPIWGREHPSPEEIFRLGLEHGRRSRERSKLIDDPDHPNKTPMPRV